MLSYLPAFVLALLLHEAGHCVAAYACGVTISEIGLGWGRRLFSFRIRKIDYVIRLLPFGAYVRFDLAQLQRRRLSQQVLVFLAGIIANLVAVIKIFSEESLAYQLLQIFVRRRNHTDVDRSR